MYSFFDNLKSKPIIILGIVLIVLLLVLSVSSSISNIGSMLGFDTKENISIKLEKTTNELEKATELLEHNALEDKVVKELDVIIDTKTVQDAIVIDNIKANEVRVLEQIKNTKVVEDEVVEDEVIVDTKPDINIIKDKPTVVYVKKKLNNKQKLSLSLLRDRAKSLKGSKS